MKTEVIYITGFLNEADWNKKSTFEFAYDLKDQVLHLKDHDTHGGASLINTIHSNLKDKFELQIRKTLPNAKVERCLVYQGGSIDEYIFENEGKKNPFVQAPIDVTRYPFLKKKK